MRSGTKLPVLQILSGVLIIASWFVYIKMIEPGYQDITLLNTTYDPVNYTHVFVSPPADPAIAVWAAGYLILGILVTGCGISQLVKYTRELEWLQITAGLLVLVLLLLFIVELEPSKAIQNALEAMRQYQPEAAIRYETGWTIVRNIWKYVSFVPGTALIAGGIYQYKKSRRQL